MAPFNGTLGREEEANCGHTDTHLITHIHAHAHTNTHTHTLMHTKHWGRHTKQGNYLHKVSRQACAHWVVNWSLRPKIKALVLFISCLKEKINACFKKIRKIIETNLIMDWKTDCYWMISYGWQCTQDSQLSCNTSENNKSSALCFPTGRFPTLTRLKSLPSRCSLRPRDQ